MDSNSSYGSANLTCHPAVVHYRYFGALLGMAVTALGSAGNTLTLLAFATVPRLRTRFNALILNLTVADLLYCGFLQPVTVDTFVHARWRQGAVACRLFGLALFVSNAVSIFSLMLIAASRYLLISDARRFDRLFCRRTLPFILALPWALGLALFGPLWRIYVFLPAVCTCSFHRSRGRPYTTILMFLMFVAGLSSIGLFYLLVHRKVRAAARALDVYRLRGGAGDPPQDRTVTGRGGEKKKKKKQSRLAEVSAQDSGIADSRSIESLGTETSIAETPGLEEGGNGDTRKEDRTAPARGGDHGDVCKQGEIPWVGGVDTPPKEGETPPTRGNKDTPKQGESPWIRDADTPLKRGETPPAAGDDEVAHQQGGEAPRAGGGRGRGETPDEGGKGPSASDAAGGANREFKRVTRMCLAMFLLYVTCYFPFCALHVADRRKRAPVLLHMVAGNFTWLNSCLNPVLYAIMNRQFRDAYRQVLRKGAGLLGCLRRH